MKSHLMFLFPLVLLLSACSIPMTTGEYRLAAKNGAALLTTETFEVKRSFAEVTQTLKVKAPECLNIAIGTNNRPVIGFGSSTRYFGRTKQTVLVSAEKAELHFQVKYENTATREPEGGSYFLVADAYPIDKNRTKVDIFRRTKVRALSEAIKGWASGENLRCPDPGTFL